METKTQFEEDSDFIVEILETLYSTDFTIIEKTSKKLEFRVFDDYIKYENKGLDPETGNYIFRALIVKSGSDPIEVTRCGNLENTTFAILSGVPIQ